MYVKDSFSTKIFIQDFCIKNDEASKLMKPGDFSSRHGQILAAVVVCYSTSLLADTCDNQWQRFQKEN